MRHPALFGLIGPALVVLVLAVNELIRGEMWGINYDWEIARIYFVTVFLAVGLPLFLLFYFYARSRNKK